jgi:general secretion pathway protein D
MGLSLAGGLLRSKLRRRAGLIFVLALSAFGAQSAALGQDHTLNLRDADIRAFIDDVSAVTGFTFIVHPAVSGKVTVVSQTPLSNEEFFQVFLSTLRVQGFTAIPTSAGAYRIVPEQAAAEDSGMGFSVDAPDDQFVTEVMRLRHADAREAAKIVKPLVNQRGQVAANEVGNVLVVVDYANNIDRIRVIVREMDQDFAEIATLSLKNMSATEMAKVINGLQEKNSFVPAASFTAVAVERGNAVLLRGDKAAVERMAAVIRDLDERSATTDSVRVIALQHADAEEIVPILKDIVGVLPDAQSEGRGAPTISHHASTNALVIAAAPDTLAALEQVIKDLDIRRAQVQVEALIVEVSDQVARDLGLQLVLAGSENSAVPFAVTNFSRSAPNLLALTGALVTDQDLSGADTGNSASSLGNLALQSLLGINGGALGIGSSGDDGLFGLILNAVANDGGSKLLSTPSVTTLDNEEADVLVGQEIPITTGEVLGANNANPFRTIDRKEVGVKLKVRPQISEGDTIKLTIGQEVSSVAGTVAGSSEIIVNTRNISTTVLADDGEIIVLGGLIEEAERVESSKVPVLGDLPFAGRAFRSEGRQKSRTNLMVFIRPTILRSKADTQTATNRKYAFMRGQEALLTPGSTGKMDALVRAVIGTPPGASE